MYCSAEYAKRHFFRFFPWRPVNPSEVGVNFFDIFCDTVLGHVNVHIDCHLRSCHASLYVPGGEPTLEADVCQGASRMLRNYGDAAAHTARRTRSTTHAHTNINNLHTSRATHHKTNHAPAAAWRRAETAFCVPVSSLAGSTGHGFRAGGTAQPETCRLENRGRQGRTGGRAGSTQLYHCTPNNSHIQKIATLRCIFIN